MNCQACQKNLSALLDRELSAAERNEVELHVAGCAICREQLQLLAKTDELVSRGIFVLDLPPALWGRIEARIAAEPARIAGLFGSLASVFSGAMIRPALGAVALTIIIVIASALIVDLYHERISGERDLQRLFYSFIEARDRLEKEHGSVNRISESSDEKQNPFVTEDRHDGSNPFKS